MRHIPPNQSDHRFRFHLEKESIRNGNTPRIRALEVSADPEETQTLKRHQSRETDPVNCPGEAYKWYSGTLDAKIQSRSEKH